ncbi:ABC transporter permease [Pseudoalteromonas sp. HM-SA03]|uniref:FecCD family ABC transporter permease n=1 Tax=Pseudoalteromonas sp. HM-SA03 TaxID=2029678 RepID=UPI000BAE0759|nr:iron ABC transporter permease [Pseudoalteromonas sp. HM-SA03]PAY00233.1 ABC transporter permease [Pseudoalteromonas sp. HM-SA03]
MTISACRETRPWPFYGLLTSLIALLICLFFTALCMGSVPLSMQSVWQILISSIPQNSDSHILWQLRLPRSLLAMLVGIHFALAGLILQAVIRNPLADPSILGVNGGASLAIVLCLLVVDYIQLHVFGFSDFIFNFAWLPVVALLGGVLATALVLKLSWRQQLQPNQLALNGVAIGAVLNALVMWAILAWGGNRTETSLIWLAGSLYGRDFSHVFLLLPWTFIGVLGCFALLKYLSILQLDSDAARTLGLNVTRWRLISLLIAVALAASATAISGPLGFVGLIVPHFAKVLLNRFGLGTSLPHLMAVCMLAGASLTLAADIASRTLISPLEIPTGTLTTLMGIPILLLLIRRQN